MEIKAFFGILSSIIIIIGEIPYFINIHNKKIHPHILSWIGWSFITALGGFAMLANNSHWVVMLLFANSLSCLLVAIYSIIKKVGVWSSSIYDFIFFSFGILGLILWQLLNEPMIALVLAIIADLSFGIPTIIKTYKSPTSEPYFSWLISSISDFLAFFAIDKFNFSEIAYPLYLFIFDITILLLILKKKTIKHSY